MRHGARTAFWLGSLLFFLSGGTGLAYEVIWFKRFAHVWGSSTMAMAAVVASFLFGLGLGALILGRVADRVRRPLVWYGVCEAAIGVLALLIPLIIAYLVEASSTIQTAVIGVPGLQFLVRFAVTCAVIGPPCALMGGTLPLLVRQFTPPESSLAHATGWLYAVNTFGAAAGCFAAGFLLLPTLGLGTTNQLTAGLNLAIGAVSIAAAWWLALESPVARRVRDGMPRRADDATAIADPTDFKPAAADPEVATAAAAPPPDDVSSYPAEPGNLLVLRVLMAATLSGAAALVLQMVWARQLSLILGGSTYAFTATLFVFLVAIALGSLLFHGWLRRYADNPLLPIGVILLLMAGTLAGKAAIPRLSLWMGEIRLERGSQWANAMYCAASGAVLEFLPAVGMGILFPLFVKLTRRPATIAGRTVGSVYAWNTAGSIAGATLTSALLIPAIGSAGSTSLALGLYLGTLLLLLPLGLAEPRILTRWVSSGVAGMAMVAVAAIPLNPLDTDLGRYLYGPVEEMLDRFDVLYFQEGSSCNVLVTAYEKDKLSLRVNGKVDAGNTADMPTQLSLAYFPRFFKPTIRDVYLIGYASGTSPGALLLFPETSVTCCEIEPAMFEAGEFFNEVNHRPMASPRLTPVSDDGRGYLQAVDQQFDLIISQPSNPWLAGVSNLFTREFYETVNERLREDGIFLQWMQLYGTTPEEFALVVRTLRTTFPHLSLLTLTHNADAILLASHQPLVPDMATAQAAQEAFTAVPAAVRDLRSYFQFTDIRVLLLKHYMMGTEELDRFAALYDSRDVINTDLNLRMEFDAPLHLFRKAEEPPHVPILRQIDENLLNRQIRAMGFYPDVPEHLVAIGEMLIHRQRYVAGIDAFQRAVERNPELVPVYRLIGESYERINKPGDALAAYQKLLDAYPNHILGNEAMGRLLVAAGRTEAGEAYLARARELRAAAGGAEPGP